MEIFYRLHFKHSIWLESTMDSQWAPILLWFYGRTIFGLLLFGCVVDSQKVHKGNLRKKGNQSKSLKKELIVIRFLSLNFFCALFIREHALLGRIFIPSLVSICISQKQTKLICLSYTLCALVLSLFLNKFVLENPRIFDKNYRCKANFLFLFYVSSTRG